LIWLAIAVYVNWHPFDFTLKPHFVAKRLAQVDLIPFADYQVSDYWNALDQFLTKSTLYLILGLILYSAFSSPKHGGSWPVVAIAAAIATVIEAGQLCLPSRYASITDILVESFGAWLGCQAMRHAALVLKAGADLRRYPNAG